MILNRHRDFDCIAAAENRSAMRMRLSIVFLSPLFFISACVFADADKFVPLLPFKLGAEWIYACKTVDKGGRVTKTETKSHVVGVHLLNNQRWYYVYEFDYGFWVRNSKQGALEADIALDEESLQLKLQSPRLFFKFPVKKGETYDLKTPDLESKMRIAEVDAKLELPAGKFECIVYEVLEDNKVASRMWLAPGVGLVKFELELIDGEAETHELVKYSIPKNKE